VNLQKFKNVTVHRSHIRAVLAENAGSQGGNVSIPKAQYLDPYSQLYVHCTMKCAIMKNWT